jgi:hypothetical protein
VKDELKRLSLTAFRRILGCERSNFYFRSRSFTLCLSDLYYVMYLTDVPYGAKICALWRARKKGSGIEEADAKVYGGYGKDELRACRGRA